MRSRALFAAASVLFAGCTLGPDYERPEVPVPEDWRMAEVAETGSLADLAWWELFEDPVLQDLIRAALEENKDLKIAVERIEQARALYGFTRANLYPHVNAGAGAGYLELSDERVGVPTDNSKGDVYAMGASLNWELDVFGRLRRATEAKRAILLSTEEARRAVIVTLVADVARAYMELRDFDRRLDVSRSTLESRSRNVVLARDLFEGGKTSEIDMRQAEAEYSRVAALVSQYEALVVQKENELSVLLGGNPGAIPRGLEIGEMPMPPAIPAGLPSMLLDRRPDVRQAEELLVAANAGIGEAKALLYPQISLTGNFGWVSQELDGLLKSPARTWGLSANLLQPVFDAGQNQRRVEFAESQQRQALYEYELSILRAFREVDDALIGQQKSGEQRDSQGLRVVAERQVLELAELRYRGGVASYLEVLDAQRSLFRAELDEAQAVRDELVSVIQLYKALGGGWSEVEAVESTESTESTETTQPEAGA